MSKSDFIDPGLHKFVIHQGFFLRLNNKSFLNVKIFNSFVSFAFKDDHRRKHFSISIRRQNNGHIPKDLSKITFFFVKKDGKFNVKITGPRQYSRDLIQGGLERVRVRIHTAQLMKDYTDNLLSWFQILWKVTVSEYRN